MGLLRKVESGIERAVGGVFGRGFQGHVQPAEMALKLVTEMEDHRVSSLSRTYVPNRFTVYLCSDDRTHFRAYERSLGEELAAHLLHHARKEGYSFVGPPRVVFDSDLDLKRGQFGIRADMVEDQVAEIARREEAAPLRWEPAAPDLPGEEVAEPAIQASRAPVAAPVPFFDVPDAPPLADLAPAPSPAPQLTSPAKAPGGLETQSIPAEVAAQMDLARQTIVLVEGSRRKEFEKGRVVLGRGRQADFQLEDPNVSRDHAAVYWENGRLFVKDLGSTNGTLLNGRPVTAGPLERGDVITLGATEVRVETG